jgi:hypothetical protein
MSKAFLEKQKNGIFVTSAEWFAPKGLEDIPCNWTKMKVRLEDGSRYILTRDFVYKNNLKWI